MRHSIDLHGLDHETALAKTEDAVIAASLQVGFTFEIITGNSNRLQKKVMKMLGSHGFDYYIPSTNLGMIVVTENVIF